MLVENGTSLKKTINISSALESNFFHSDDTLNVWYVLAYDAFPIFIYFWDKLA